MDRVGKGGGGKGEICARVHVVGWDLWEGVWVCVCVWVGVCVCVRVVRVCVCARARASVYAGALCACVFASVCAP